MAVTKLEKITLDALVEMFAPSVQDRIREMAAREDVTHLVVFTNIDMSSSHLGDMTAVIVGPGCTYKTLDEIKDSHLGQVPSVFQYPTHYAEAHGNM